MKRDATIMISIGTIVTDREKTKLKNVEILDGRMNIDVLEIGFKGNGSIEDVLMLNVTQMKNGEIGKIVQLKEKFVKMANVFQPVQINALRIP